MGSELRALTTARSSATAFPAVSALQTLAADVRGMLGAETILTYAADWSEYFGHQPQDGSGDVLFHLDPLWGDVNIDVVGVDWYPPLTDWRDGADHLDAALATSAYDPDYLEGRIEAGEGYAFYYASDAARDAQTRTSISDGAYDEPWVFRPKDIRNFWSRAHHNRPGGLRSGTATDWSAQVKPVWLIELGCPAVDKGANAPNLFIDAKSSESAIPPFSSGARDDLIQRRTLEAYLRHWDTEGHNNPLSDVTDEPMIGESFLWCWDARPYPAFPARGDVWTDGESWRRGHWLNGRAGLSDLAEVVAHICARAGVEDVAVTALTGAVGGYVIDSPASARTALEPLMAAYNFVAVEREGRITFLHRADHDPINIVRGDLAAQSAASLYALRGDSAEAPVEARVRFLDPARDYRIAGVSARRLDGATSGVETIEAPLTLEADVAETIAVRLLSDRRAQAESLTIEVGPAHLGLEPADCIMLEGGDVFEIGRIEDAETRRLHVTRAPSRADSITFAPSPDAPSPTHAPKPAFSILDLPPLPGSEADERPLAAIFAAPWLGVHELFAGASEDALSRRCRAAQPAIMGELLWALWPGPVDRWDDGNVIRIRLYGGTLASVSRTALLNGANVFAVESESEWEIVQAATTVLVGPNEYELSGFLRGQLASSHAMRAPHPVGARIVKLDARLTRLDVSTHEWGDELLFAAPPAGGLANDPRAAAAEFILPHAAVRPWPPAHVRARRLAGGDVSIGWVRCARAGGDFWGAGDPPLDVSTEAYQVDILDGAVLKRSVNVSGATSCLYTVAQQTADFAAPPGSLRLRVAQCGAGGALGLNTELTIPL